MEPVLVREAHIEEIVQVHASIPEFENQPAAFFTKRYEGFAHLLLVAEVDGQQAGYLVAYEKPEEECLYIWMAAVVPAFRRAGAMSALFAYTEQWAQINSYTRVRIKTRNGRREMLFFLVKNNFLFYAVEEREDARENRIYLEKPL